MGGHSGIEQTYRRIASLFYCKGLREDVHTYVNGYDICQRHKYDRSPYPRLLQPLKLPVTAWRSISMDFIKGLPKSKGKTVILVVVDRLTKYAYFLSLSHPYSASEVAKLFTEHVYKLHGMRDDIVSERDPSSPAKFGKN